MKIALFSDTFFPQINGVVNVVHNLAEVFTRRGHEVCVVSPSRDCGEVLEQKLGVLYRVVTVPSVPFYVGERIALPTMRIKRLISEFKPDIIHAHTPFATGWGAVSAARHCGVPLVGTHHTFFDQYLGLWHLNSALTRHLSWRLTNMFYNHCDTVTTPSHALMAAMRQKGLRAHMEIIVNPVQLSAFTPRAVGHAGEHPSIVYMGRVSSEKNIGMVIAAFHRVVESNYGSQHPDAHLFIIGDGPHRKKLESMADMLGIRNRVVFTGFLRGDALAEELRRHGVFVTASISENMPLSVLESMASGLPVVAVAALGMPEIVDDGINGFLVQPGDAEDMAQRIVNILEDSERRTAFSNAAREKALQYDPDRVAAHFELLYEKLISEHALR